MRVLGLALAIVVALGCPASVEAKRDVPRFGYGARDVGVQVGGVSYPVKLIDMTQDWYKKCQSGKAASCAQLGDAFASGLGDLPTDWIAAAGFYTMACDGGDGEACSSALDLFREPALANHAKEDAVTAIARRGCETLRNANACGHLALMQFLGLGVPQDKDRAIVLWDKSCSPEGETACRLEAETLYATGDTELGYKGYKVYYEQCDKNEWGWACAGDAMANWEHRYINEDKAYALDMAKWSCTGAAHSSPAGCMIYASDAVYRGGEEAKLATKLLLASCKAGVGEACYQAGLASKATPRGTPYKPKEALYYLRVGCDANHGESCRALGEYYARGNFVSPDKAVALALYDRACSLGSGDGCSKAKALIAAQPGLRGTIPAINPAEPSSVQVATALQWVDEHRDLKTVVAAMQRLNVEEMPEAQYVIGLWFDRGVPGMVTQDRASAVQMFENAAKGDLPAAQVEYAMAMWNGDHLKQDKPTATAWMQRAAAKGSQMAKFILPSMEAEAQRQEHLEYTRTWNQRVADMYARAARVKAAQAAWNHAGYVYASYGRSAAGDATARAASANMRAAQARADQDNWDRAMSYYSGGTSVCPAWNSYC